MKKPIIVLLCITIGIMAGYRFHIDHGGDPSDYLNIPTLVGTIFGLVGAFCIKIYIDFTNQPADEQSDD